MSFPGSGLGRGPRQVAVERAQSLEYCVHQLLLVTLRFSDHCNSSFLFRDQQPVGSNRNALLYARLAKCHELVKLCRARRAKCHVTRISATKDWPNVTKLDKLCYKTLAKCHEIVQLCHARMAKRHETRHPSEWIHLSKGHLNVIG